jgi:hypothetical protein
MQLLALTLAWSNGNYACCVSGDAVADMVFNKNTCAHADGGYSTTSAAPERSGLSNNCKRKVTRNKIEVNMSLDWRRCLSL